VIDNLDCTGQGRVQVQLLSQPDKQPWARVATFMGGGGSGAFFIPQKNDKVLVAFNSGDVNDAYILGCLWNGIDRPPTLLPTDAVTKRIIRTPQGHEVEFDDAGQSITITNSTSQKITIDPSKVEIATTEGKTTLTLDSAGNVSIRSALSIHLNAPTITIEGDAVTINGQVRTKIGGGLGCDIRAALVISFAFYAAEGSACSGTS
jgi:uncharacterized protein involved in type VI secretion and phage assembly